MTEYVLLGFVVFISLILLFIAWALRSGQRQVDYLIKMEEQRIKERRPADPNRFGPP